MAFTVAIDGPAASGKGTISRAVARRFGLAHLDTGLLYRAVGKKVAEGADPVEAARALVAADLDAPDLRGDEVAQAASRVAVIAGVRGALFDFQRAFARRDGGAVLDGRDIGTVICPEADVKLFITASPAARAARRLAELTARGVETSAAAVMADLLRRDERDRSRDAAPLERAADAILIDTSDMSIEAAIAAASAHVAAPGGN